MANIYQACLGNEIIPTTEQITEKCFEAAETQSNPSVNLVTGGLKYVFGDLSIGQGLYNIGISHVYNSKLNSAFNSKICGIGNGWKLNLHQCLLLDGVDENNNVTIKYLDELGDVHKFVMFDSSNLRFYNVQNAKVVLTVQQTETVISDGVGNKLIFNNDTGMLVRSVSCQTDELVKHYIYENNRLVRVYVNKTLVNGVVKRKIELSYDNTGLLNSIATYSDASEKLAMLTYEYDQNNNLTKVIRKGITPSGIECLNKDIGEFQYTNGKLSAIYDSETCAMLKVDYYANGKVNKISNGYVSSSGVKMGQAANALFNGYSDGTYCGNVNETFVKKSHLSYAYYTNSDGVINEVITTSDKDISMAYFLDSDGNIVSSFEVKPTDSVTYYSSLEKETEYKTGAFIGTSGNERINGKSPFVFNGNTINTGTGMSANFTQGVPNLVEMGKNCISFNYSFWLKLNGEYSRPKAKIIYSFANSSIEKTNHVEINGKAKGVWQKVSVPVVYKETGGSCLHNLTKLNIQICQGENNPIPNCEMVEIGFTPAPINDFILSLPNNEVKFDAVETFDVVLYDGSYSSFNGATSVNYFTADDLVSTISNKLRSYYSEGVQLYDVICNAGTKRISNVRDIVMCANTLNYAFAESTPIGIQRMALQNGCGKIDTEYTHNIQDSYMQINTKSSIFTEEQGTIQTSAFQKIDYKGNKLEEQDEYGMGVMYLYDKYGNPTCTKKYYLDSNKNKVVYETHTTSYDSKLEYAIAADDGISGVAMSYNKHGNVYGVAEKVLSAETNQMTPTGVNTSSVYGVFPEKVVSTSLNENGRSKVQKSITYQNGYVRTVSDGTVKFGIQQDFINDVMTYTQFKDDKEVVVKKEIVENNFTSDGMCQDSIEKFFRDEDVVTDTIISRQTPYGKLASMAYGEKQLTVQYQNGSESAYVQKPVTITDEFSQRIEKPTYNKLQEQVGWQETLSNGNNHLKVLQAGEGFTKYTFGADENEDYFSYIEKDSAKILSPRINATAYFRDKHSDYDAIKNLAAFKRNYTYDKIGRVSYVNSDAISKESKFTSNISYSDDRANSPISSMSFNGTAIGIDSYQEGQSGITYFYDHKDNVISASKNLTWWRDSRYGSELSVNESHQYTYNKHDKLLTETIRRNGSQIKNTQYVYSRDGRLESVTTNGNTANLVYVNGQLSRFGTTSFTYDNYGNRISKTKSGTTTNYTFARGDLLTSISGTDSITYTYNANGVRTQKVVGNTTISYYLDGNKILGEDRIDADGNIVNIRYFYDKDGICGVRCIKGNKKDNYVFAKDAQGSILYIFDGDNPSAKPYAEYTYDAWGNCTVFTHNSDRNGIGYLNPFRWKGHYYDEESGLYYANNSYYDPEFCQYLDAAPLDAVFDNVDIPQPIDRNGLLCNNVFEFAPNVFAIYLTRDLSVDYSFDLDANLPWYVSVWRAILTGLAALAKWWQEDVPNWVKVTVGIILLIAAVVLAYFTGGASTALVSSAEVISTLISQALTQLLIGIGLAVASWAISGLITGDFSYQSLENAVADAVFFTGLFAFVSASANALKGASRCTTHPKQSVECATKCFLAGTLVICKDDNGNVLQKPIEEIKIGDLVWSFDEETGKNDWKPVVHLFRNQATEWTEVTVDGEKIISTPGHRYYLPETKTWCTACQITVGTKLLLSDGNFGVVESANNLFYDFPQTTYNFEVSEFHTYYVAKGVLVHNDGLCDKLIQENSRKWNEAVKTIQSGEKKKLNYYTKDQKTAIKLISEAGLPYKGTGYLHEITKYPRGYEIHPIDNSVRLPHIRFWNGRTNGHIYWLK